MKNETLRFPIGGPKDDVFNFLQAHGYIMSKWSDKHWTRADGLHLHVYGAGSMARITKDGSILADAPIEEAITAIELK